MAHNTSKRSLRWPRQRGVALLAAIVSIALIHAVMWDFNTTTNIDDFAAKNARDNMKAEFLARSAVNISRLVIAVQTDLIEPLAEKLGEDNPLKGIQITDYTDLFMGAFCGSGEEVSDMAGLLGGGLELGAIEGLGLPEGDLCSVDITTEDSKLNLNCAAGSAELVERLAAMLTALIYPAAYNPIFEGPDGDGWRRDRQMQVQAIIDYIDRDGRKYGSSGSEDYGYESLADAYEAKNYYLDSIGEAKLIRGIDDRFWTLFGDAFTIYGDCEINVKDLSDARLIAAVILLAAPEGDPVATDPRRLWELAELVARGISMGYAVGDAAAFARLVKDPVTELGLYIENRSAVCPWAAAATAARKSQHRRRTRR